MSNYKPTKEDIHWMEGLISLMQDGGSWFNSWGMGTVLKQEKKIKFKLLEDPVEIDMPVSDMINTDEFIVRTKTVLEYMGWSLEVDDEKISI